MRLLVTGGCGFIGTHLVRHLVEAKGAAVINLDKLSYAANPASLADLADHPNYRFVNCDLASPIDRRPEIPSPFSPVPTLDQSSSPSETDPLPAQPTLNEVFWHYRPDAVLHLAAESHVDRSIEGPEVFIRSNTVGTYHILQASLQYWRSLAADGCAGAGGESYATTPEAEPSTFGRSHRPTQKSFRFLHVSTDEVFGTLAPEAPPFTEDSPYAPRSPYAASKAAADHLVQAWHTTYGLPVILTHCGNNFGPNQHAEKLIPTVIRQCRIGEAIPVYGSGQQVRDWIYVEDHCEALDLILERGTVGERYLIGAENERENIELVRTICKRMDALRKRATGDGRRAADRQIPDSSDLAPGETFESLIRFVTDRPGHDFRYAIDASKLKNELGWKPRHDFETALGETVAWYVAQTEPPRAPTDEP